MNQVQLVRFKFLELLQHYLSNEENFLRGENLGIFLRFFGLKKQSCDQRHFLDVSTCSCTDVYISITNIFHVCEGGERHTNFYVYIYTITHMYTYTYTCAHTYMYT